MQLIWRPVAFSNGPAISTSLTGAEIQRLMELATDSHVLEIGSAYGYSTVGLALVSAKVTAIDPHVALGSIDALWGNLDAYGVTDKVDVRVGYSQDELPELHAAGRLFDLVWIDGDHEQPAVTHDVNWALKLLRPGGVLACHDYDEATCPGVRPTLDAKFLRPPDELVDTLAIYKDPA